MPLFSISKGKLKPIKSKPFDLEKEIQNLTENNLSSIFGLQLVASEFKVRHFRFDTISFDSETKSFVIIEFKKDQKFSVIDQGYAYLSLMLNNKSDFIVEYNEKLNENLKRSDVDWSQSKIIFISPTFTSYQREAINFEDLPIELYEIKRYSNQTISYNKIKAPGSTEKIKSISKKDKKLQKVAKEIKIHTEDEFLKSKTINPKIVDLYLELKNEIFKIDESIDQKITKTMSCFYSGGKGMVWFDPWKHQLRVHLRKGKYPNKYKKLNPSGWGGYPEITVRENE